MKGLMILARCCTLVLVRGADPHAVQLWAMKHTLIGTLVLCANSCVAWSVFRSLWDAAGCCSGVGWSRVSLMYASCCVCDMCTCTCMYATCCVCDMCTCMYATCCGPTGGPMCFNCCGTAGFLYLVFSFRVTLIEPVNEEPLCYPGQPTHLASRAHRGLHEAPLHEAPSSC